MWKGPYEKKIWHLKRKKKQEMHYVICIYTTYATVIVSVSRTSLSAMSKADMKSNETVAHGSSKGFTIGRSASRTRKEEKKRKERK